MNEVSFSSDLKEEVNEGFYSHFTNLASKSGSYLQVIHEHGYTANGGVITCSEFVDVNGKRHERGIPAIRLE